MTACFLSFLSEQRKKYSNSNIIMHETSQYHVQVSSKIRSPGFHQRNPPMASSPSVTLPVPIRDIDQIKLLMEAEKGL